MVNNGEVGQNGNNIEITKDGYRVVLAQEGNGKKWVLTAFDNSKTKKEKLSSANTPGTPIGTSRAVAADDNTSSEAKNSTLVNTTDTGKTSERGKRNDTATPQSTVSEGKDSNNSYSLQEKEEKSAKINTSDPMEAIKQAAEAFREERTLMGVHNISEDKLKKALKQGGLANPSMAVFDTRNYAQGSRGDRFLGHSSRHTQNLSQ